MVGKRKKAEEKGAGEDKKANVNDAVQMHRGNDSMTSRYAGLSREQLATLVPELLLIGQLIDRSGMAWCISTFGRDGMLQIAIEEWAGASPVYTRRMQKALKYEGDDVITIFKGLQLDIGAPPQFMDFRYTVHDRWHGEFHLDHCGALMDVEPMGEDYVRGMCHDIEDPTFDATAVATNRRAQVRPIHRPPRVPADRHPHCAWTVIIDESYPRVSEHPGAGRRSARTRAATTELDPIDPADEGEADYSGALLSDFDFGAFSHSALVRIADEVCLQMHLLNLSFVIAVGKRAKTDVALAKTICTKQLIGIAGVAAERIHARAGVARRGRGRDAGARTASAVQPGGLRDRRFRTRLRGMCAGRPPTRMAPGSRWSGRRRTRRCRRSSRPSIRTCDVEISGTETDWTARVIETDTAAEELPEVAVAKFSRGASWVFEDRKSLPLTVV